MATNNHYHHHARELKRDLRRAIDREELRQLHRKKPWRHFAIVFRQLLLAGVAGYLVITTTQTWIWIGCCIILGFVAFGWTTLLHEVIHGAIFQRSHPRWSTFIGHCYAILGGLSKTQFTNWHLDHHAELGCGEDDPKRAHLTPKIVARWYKFLYMTPALFPIYFRAAAKATAKYPEQKRQQIRRERIAMILFHFTLLALLIWCFGAVEALKIHAIPYFFIFPIAFTVNRLGQHYSIDPEDPAKWTTLMKGNFFWDFVYIYSNYHLEHHYFPNVPCYNLPQLQRLLTPFYRERGIAPQSYRSLLYGWLVDNRVPHTHWLQ